MDAEVRHLASLMGRRQKAGVDLGFYMQNSMVQVGKAT